MGNGVTILRLPARLTLEDVAKLAAGPLERAGAVRAVVFGSFARGDADGYSDLDLVVVLRTDLPFVERGRLLGELVDALPVHVDVAIYTPEEYARGMKRGYGIFDALQREGVTIHERRAA
jgi:predicted nucleotidyltransferase